MFAGLRFVAVLAPIPDGLTTSTAIVDWARQLNGAAFERIQRLPTNAGWMGFVRLRGIYATLSLISARSLDEDVVRELRRVRKGRSEMPFVTISQAALLTWVVDLERRRLRLNKMPPLTTNRYPKRAISRRLSALQPSRP
jgi:hypothetical protein